MTDLLSRLSDLRHRLFDTGGGGLRSQCENCHSLWTHGHADSKPSWSSGPFGRNDIDGYCPALDTPSPTETDDAS